MKLLTKSQNIIDSLAKINIYSSEDLLNYLPYRYEDNSYSDESELEDKQKITILGKLVSNPRHIRAGKFDLITFFFVSVNGKFYNIKLFNRSYMMNQLSLSEQYSISGVFDKGKKEIAVSKITKGEISKEKMLRGVYHLPSDLASATFYKLLERTYYNFQKEIIDEIPNVLKSKYRLLDKKEALRMVHFPTEEKEIALGLRTLKYHECLYYCLKNQWIRGEHKRIPTVEKKLIPTKKINEFILNLDFKLTSSQIVAVREIILDMNNKSLMYRLLQGDVGTGKTIVSAIALYGNYLRNKVGAFMVPTDSLARQQYEYLNKLFAPYNIKVGLLIGSLSMKEKNRIKNNLKNGEIDVIVGTHALFSKDVTYSSLGLALIDEQHRFGVNQRNELISKDDGCDLLLMSATPIPRTLALSIYGDLDISTLNEFPSSKRDVFTNIVHSKSAEIISLIKECLEEQRQVFIVAPKIENKDDSLSSADKIFEMYNLLFPNQVKLLHGKMKSEEKAEILDSFIKGEFLILVSTTVIELGINVLNAGAIIIYSASSFGLASLHQLRGRVGRNGKEATCLLVNDNIEDERLKILKESNDGFYIAEMDMKLRGPGDTLGLAQSGFPTFSSLNIVDDFRMFECARDDAKNILANQNSPQFVYYINYAKEQILKENEITLFD